MDNFDGQFMQAIPVPTPQGGKLKFKPITGPFYSTPQAVITMERALEIMIPLFNLTGDSFTARSILVMDYSPMRKCVKITTTSDKGYAIEPHVHKELHTLTLTDHTITNKIMPFHEHSEFTHETPIVLHLGNDVRGILPDRYVSKIDGYSDGLTMQYIVTDYNDKYSSILDAETHFRNKYIREPRLVLFLTLIHLNRKIGFVHWDLHLGNLLVNKENGFDFLLFDFDLSETNSVKNDVVFSRYLREGNGTIDIQGAIEGLVIDGTFEEKRKLYGLGCDMLFYFLTCKQYVGGFDMRYFESDTVKYIMECIMYFSHSDTRTLFTVMIPTLCQKLSQVVCL